MSRRRRLFEPPTYVFRVRILGGGYAPENCREIWRDIELAGNQTVLELGEGIPDAFGFDDPHLWCFFLSGRKWDMKSAYALEPLDESYGRPAETLGASETPPRKEFLYLFDFGDQWKFGVKRVRTGDALEPGAHYPRVVAKNGEAPPQYPDFDDSEGPDAVD